MKEIKLNCWDKFGKELQSFEEKRLRGQCLDKFLYRGQGNSCWQLESTLERYDKREMSLREYHHLISVVKPQIESFTETNWNILSYPDEFDRWLEEYETLMPHSFGNTDFKDTYNYMVYLRHYGFPSPLIDWTSSPYVAAYFAFKNPSHKGKYVSIYVFLESTSPTGLKSGSDDRPYIYKLGPYVKTDPRHFIQQSQYTICVINNNGEWRYTSHEQAFNLENPNQDILWKFKIPCSERLKVLKQLDSYNINDLSLFGSEESLMNTMALREIHFRDLEI